MHNRKWLTATVLTLGGLGIGGGLLWRAQQANPIVRLASAMGPNVDFDARLSGGFQPRAPIDVRRSGATPPRRLPPDALVEIGRIERFAKTARRSEVVQALGAAYLVQGDVDLAIATFEEAIARTDGASEWNDLSAACLVKAERTPARRIEYLARALEAASRSLARAPSNDARFNRALALEALSSYVGPADGWQQYLAAERDPVWREVATRRSTNSARAVDARGAWDERKPALRAHARSGDRRFVDETVSLFPQATLDLLDQEVLVEWARASLSGDGGTAAAALHEAATLADAFGAATGDAMPKDAVGQIATSNGGARREIARAHLAYAEAVRKLSSDHYLDAMRDVDDALAGFTRSQSVYWAWAAFQKARIFYQQRQLDRSREVLEAVEAFARRHDYPTLFGRTLRQRGLDQLKQWHPTEALGAWQEAIRRFEVGHQRDDAAGVYSLVGDALRSLGKQHDGWEYIAPTLDGLARVQAPQSRYRIMLSVSLFAAREGFDEAALLFQHATVREARAASAGRLVEALIYRAMMLFKRGAAAAALRDLDEARAQRDAVADADLKRGLTAEADILMAELEPAAHAPPAVASLHEALQFFSGIEPSFVPRLYLDLARVHLAARAYDEAARAFDEGIAELEGQQARLDDEALKISYFDESWNLYPEMIAFLADVRHDPAQAFAYAERSRGRLLRSSARPIGLSELQALVPDSLALVYYVTLADRLLTWTITRSTVDLTTTRIGREELARLVTRYRLPLSEDWAEDTASGAALYDALIAPVARRVASTATLVFLPDGDLQRLPFATLRQPRSGRFLIEDHAILVAPSASFLAAEWSGRRGSPAPIESALLVGNPALGADTSLPPLPDAEAEAVAAARFYLMPHVLLGADATKAAFLRLAPENDVVHFGGHAVINAQYPLLSRLPLAPAVDGGVPEPLFAHEISRLRFDRTRLVVLGACSTAAGAVSRGEGVMSLARPFLIAGVPTVVATQWDVSDRDSKWLLLAFHQELAKTRDPVQALQVAQLQLLRGREASLARPRSWGAFVALGRLRN